MIIEPVCLSIISLVFGLRVFYIHFNNVEVLFGIAALLLAIIYLKKMFQRYRAFQAKNKVLSFFVILFHLSIVLFLVSLALVPFMPMIAESTGIVSFALLMIFIMAGFIKKNLLVEGESLSAFKMVRQYKGHSFLLITMIIMFSFYVGFTKIGVLPAIYSDEYPKAYFELVNKATTEKEKSVDGEFKHEKFKEKYDQFIKRNKNKEK